MQISSHSIGSEFSPQFQRTCFLILLYRLTNCGLPRYPKKDLLAPSVSWLCMNVCRCSAVSQPPLLQSTPLPPPVEINSHNLTLQFSQSSQSSHTGTVVSSSRQEGRRPLVSHTFETTFNCKSRLSNRQTTHRKM